MRSAGKCPPPDDFTEAVENGMTVLELSVRYGVRSTKITEWKRELGLTGKARKAPSPEDMLEEINLCLHCKRVRCNGNCLDLYALRRRRGE